MDYSWQAKQDGVPFVQHVAQAVAEMYASAKYLMYDSGSLPMLFINVEPHSTRKGILRGALTNGHEWIFLILYLNEDGNGGTYAESPTIKIQVSDSYSYRVLSPGPDIVPGLLRMLPLSFLPVLLRTDVRCNIALMILMRMTGFLPSNDPLVESIHRS